MQTYNPYFRKLVEGTLEEAAKNLLGAVFVTLDSSAQIVEVEAYGGQNDPGSHAYRRLTPRNSVMFGEPGRLYMYFTYGNHWMANVVCRPEGEPCALLIRAAIPLTGIDAVRQRRPHAKTEYDLLSGPGKFAQGLALNGTHYGMNLFDTGSPIHIEPGEMPSDILTTTRIGLAKGRGDDLFLRFLDQRNIAWCSKR